MGVRFFKRTNGDLLILGRTGTSAFDTDYIGTIEGEEDLAPSITHIDENGNLIALYTYPLASTLNITGLEPFDLKNKGIFWRGFEGSLCGGRNDCDT